MNETLGVAIIGAGRVASAHCRAVKATPGTRVVAIADTDIARAEALATQNECAPVRDYQDALARSDVDFAIIALPHWLHHKAAIDCANAGKHIFVEKPMADTVEECDEMIAAAKKNDVHLFVAHTQRFFASTIAARELLESGRIGKPIFATDTWYKNFGLEGRPAWFLDRSGGGGGMWLMNGAHMIDRSCWVLDSEVAAVKAWIGNPIYNLSADDSAMAFLQLKNGLNISIIHSGYKSGVQKCEVEILGTEGMLKFDSYSNHLEVENDGAYEPIEVTRHDPFQKEVEALAHTIRTGAPLPVSVEWGRHMVDVLCACEESSRTGREVVLG
jgi:phthalate 4,5-cis-dihydrodiol dehydrogenase